MVRLRITSHFYMKEYAKVNAIKKQSERENEFLEGDIIECDNAMAEYINGGNALKQVFAKVIETIPEKEIKEEIKEQPKEEQIKKVAKKRKKKLDK